MKRLIFWMTAVVVASLAATMAKAQTAVIGQTRGQVCDVASGEPMIGVTMPPISATNLCY